MKRQRESAGRSPLLMILYYAALVAAGILIIILFPQIQEEQLALGRLTQLQSGLEGEITETLTGTRYGTGFDVGQVGLGLIAISVLSPLGIMIPVAWTYIIVKRKGGYDQSVVHTLLILPVAVTGIVLVVQHSLALAFSLAGIVAAVRFRTTLEDVKDAVYVFLAIGVGLACGVQALGMALVLSVAFNVVNLTLWKLNFGNIYADQAARTHALPYGDLLAGPESAQTALAIGDKRLLSALTRRDLKEVAERRARMESYLAEDAESHKERKQYSVLMVYVDKVGLTQPMVERHLENLSVRWRLVEILPGEEGTSIMEYLVRMKEGYHPGALLDAVREEGGEHVRAAELRSLRTLQKSS